MNARTARLGWWLAEVSLIGCRTEPVDDGSLAAMKRIQESRLTYSCIVDHSALAHGGMAMEVIQACQKAANARIW